MNINKGSRTILAKKATIKLFRKLVVSPNELSMPLAVIEWAEKTNVGRIIERYLMESLIKIFMLIKLSKRYLNLIKDGEVEIEGLSLKQAMI